MSKCQNTPFRYFLALKETLGQNILILKNKELATDSYTVRLLSFRTGIIKKYLLERNGAFIV